MSLYLLIIPAAAVLWFLLDRRIATHYRPGPTPHQDTPADHGIRFEPVEFPAVDGGTLRGWWVPGKEQAPVLILVHGWSNNAGRLMRFIRELHPLGYNLLAFDARSHGDSSYTAPTTVWSYTEDTLQAIRFVRERTGSPVGLIGFSIGGGAVINAAAHTEGIRSVLTVGAMAHPLEVMRLTFDARGVPYFPLVWLLFKYLDLRYRIGFDRIAPLRHVSRVRAELFLIHGDTDSIVLPDQGRKLAAAANPERSRFWLASGLAHGEWDHLPLFWERVKSFLEETVPAP